MWGGAPLVKWPVRGCPPKNWGVPPYQMPLYKQLEPFAEVAGLAIGDPVGQSFSSTEQQQYTTITTIGHEC